jgi:hypothetical protein
MVLYNWPSCASRLKELVLGLTATYPSVMVHAMETNNLASIVHPNCSNHLPLSLDHAPESPKQPGRRSRQLTHTAFYEFPTPHSTPCGLGQAVPCTGHATCSFLSKANFSGTFLINPPCFLGLSKVIYHQPLKSLGLSTPM